MMEITRSGAVAVLRMAHGKANAMDVAMLRELSDALSEIERSEAGAAVLVGFGTIFSAGVDLFRILEGRAYLLEFLPALSESLQALFAFSKPMVAAINGHAIAGGFILACACDYRVMAEGEGRIGIPELRVGVPFPLVALEIVRFALPPDVAQEAILLGRTLEPGPALARGYVHELAAPESLLDRAWAVARDLARVPPASFARAKADLRRPTMERWERSPGAVDESLVEAWASPTVQSAVRQYVEKTLQK